MAKTRKGFDWSLIGIGMFGFFMIALNSFDIIDLTPWGTTVFMLLAGTAFLYEGQVSTIRRWGADGIQRPEFPFVMSIFLGLFTIVIGVLAMPFIGIESPQLKGITGFVAILAIAWIALETWVFD